MSSSFGIKQCLVLLLLQLLLTIPSSTESRPGQHGNNGKTTKTKWTTKANLPDPRSDFAIVQRKSSAFIVGGCRIPYVQNGGCIEVVDTVWEYNAKTDKYTNLTTLPSPRWRHAAGIIGNLLVVFGGFADGAETVRNATDVYDFRTRTWTSFPGGDVNNFSDLNGFVLGGTLFASGGYIQPTYDSQPGVYRYSGSGKWDLVATLQEPRGDGLAAVTLASAFLAGGYDPSANTSIVEVFSKSGSSQLLSASSALMIPARIDAAFCSVKNTLVAVGGETGSWPTTLVDSAMYLGVRKTQHGKIVPTPKGWITVSTPSHDATRRFRCQCASLIGSTIHVFGGQTVNSTSGEFRILTRVDQLSLPC